MRSKALIKAQKKYYLKNRSNIIMQKKTYKKNNINRIREYHANRYAKLKAETLQEAHVLFLKICPEWEGTHMLFSTKKGRVQISAEVLIKAIMQDIRKTNERFTF